MSKREAKLVQPKDWDQWIYIVRTKATSYLVWEYIDLSNEAKPE